VPFTVENANFGPKNKIIPKVQKSFSAENKMPKNRRFRRRKRKRNSVGLYTWNNCFGKTVFR